MEKSNSKILTLSFAVAGIVLGLAVHFVILSFAGAFGVVARLSDSDLVRHGLPVAIGLGLFLALQFNSKVLIWAEEVVNEIKKVVWPTRKDMVAMTVSVCIMVLISSVIVTSFDFVSGYVLNYLIK